VLDWECDFAFVGVGDLPPVGGESFPSVYTFDPELLKSRGSLNHLLLDTGRSPACILFSSRFKVDDELEELDDELEESFRCSLSATTSFDNFTQSV
jgi:hypothetical protein